MSDINPKHRLHILYRVEPGCLGPEGARYIDDYCVYANQHIPALPYATFEFVPRNDKSLPEWEFSLNKKSLSDSHVTKYLNLLNTDVDTLDDYVCEHLANTIDTFLGR